MSQSFAIWVKQDSGRAGHPQVMEDLLPAFLIANDSRVFQNQEVFLQLPNAAFPQCDPLDHRQSRRMPQRFEKHRPLLYCHKGNYLAK
jgi:hypothetical protein